MNSEFEKPAATPRADIAGASTQKPQPSFLLHPAPGPHRAPHPLTLPSLPRGSRFLLPKNPNLPPQSLVPPEAHLLREAVMGGHRSGDAVPAKR